MPHSGMLIVKHEGCFHGPFVSGEADLFASELGGASEVFPLSVPQVAGEHSGPWEVHMLEAGPWRTFVDSHKVETKQVLAGVIQEFHLARREQRVLTVAELMSCWDGLYQVAYAVESLMHYVDQVVADPTPENLVAVRKALWRNRDSDDVDPHYADRFW